jgi:hypothetical protein
VWVRVRFITAFEITCQPCESFKIRYDWALLDLLGDSDLDGDPGPSLGCLAAASPGDVHDWNRSMAVHEKNEAFTFALE